MEALQENELERVHCGRCGYPLVGVGREGNCPECGASAAGAVSVSAFFARDEARRKWTRAGLNVVLAAFLVEGVWALVYAGVIAGLGWVGLGHVKLTAWVMGMNATVLWLGPLAGLGGAYLLFYGITQVNKTGWAVRARVMLIWLFAIWGVGVGSAWMGLWFADWYFLSGFYYLMRMVWVFPTALTVVISAGMMLLIRAMEVGGSRLRVKVWALGRWGAYGAVAALLMLSLMSQGIYWWVQDAVKRQQANSWIYYGGPLARYAPEWSVYIEITNGIGANVCWPEAETLRLRSICALHMSDSGGVSLLKWVNMLAWWGSDGTTPYTSSFFSLFEVTQALSYGLPDSQIAGWMIIPPNAPGTGLSRFWLWPEMVWCGLGLMASLYLWVYVVVQAVRMRRALPRVE